VDVIVVPAWRRPDFLKAALTRLLALDGREHVRFLIALDRGYSPNVWGVTQWFANQAGRPNVTVLRRRHAYRGNSFNVLTSYRDAAGYSPDLVHLVEEDIFVAHDYLSAAHAVHAAEPKAFAVSACRNQQFEPGVDPPAEASGYFMHPAYQSLAVSFRPESLSAVLAHAQPEYYANPVRYCQGHFPNTVIPVGNAEQDGLIHRIVEERGGTVGYLALPRAYHAGFTGYHRKGALLPGDVDTRARRLLEMTTEELNGAAFSYPDHAAVPLDAARAAVTTRIDWPNW
jgi:hypothetical protein